nr:helix-turn-helix domain-containing protein [uncultured Cardiobacterium sp.]
MSKYTLHFKYQAVLHYLHIRSQQRTADHYGISRTHLRRWIPDPPENERKAKAEYWQKRAQEAQAK